MSPINCFLISKVLFPFCHISSFFFKGMSSQMSLFQVHLLLVVSVERVFAYIRLLCCAWWGSVCASPAQADSRPATCDSVEWCPPNKVQASCAVSEGSQRRGQVLLELNKRWEKHAGCSKSHRWFNSLRLQGITAVDVRWVGNLTFCLAVFLR